MGAAGCPHCNTSTGAEGDCSDYSVEASSNDLVATGEYGYVTDAQTGLVLAGHRYYSPSTMRWMNRDRLSLGSFCPKDAATHRDRLATSYNDD